MRAHGYAERFGIFFYSALRFEKMSESAQRNQLSLHIADILADLGDMIHDLHDVRARGRQCANQERAVEHEKDADDDRRRVSELHIGIEKQVILRRRIVEAEHEVAHGVIVAFKFFLFVFFVGESADQPNAADILLYGKVDVAVRAAHIREYPPHHFYVANERDD